MAQQQQQQQQQDQSSELLYRTIGALASHWVSVCLHDFYINRKERRNVQVDNKQRAEVEEQLQKYHSEISNVLNFFVSGRGAEDLDASPKRIALWELILILPDRYRENQRLPEPYSAEGGRHRPTNEVERFLCGVASVIIERASHHRILERFARDELRFPPKGTGSTQIPNWYFAQLLLRSLANDHHPHNEPSSGGGAMMGPPPLSSSHPGGGGTIVERDKLKLFAKIMTELRAAPPELNDYLPVCIERVLDLNLSQLRSMHLIERYYYFTLLRAVPAFMITEDRLRVVLKVDVLPAFDASMSLSGTSSSPHRGEDERNRQAAAEAWLELIETMLLEFPSLMEKIFTGQTDGPSLADFEKVLSRFLEALTLTPKFIGTLLSVFAALVANRLWKPSAAVHNLYSLLDALCHHTVPPPSAIMMMMADTKRTAGGAASSATSLSALAEQSVHFFRKIFERECHVGNFSITKGVLNVLLVCFSAAATSENFSSSSYSSFNFISELGLQHWMRYLCTHFVRRLRDRFPGSSAASVEDHLHQRRFEEMQQQQQTMYNNNTNINMNNPNDGTQNVAATAANVNSDALGNAPTTHMMGSGGTDTVAMEVYSVVSIIAAILERGLEVENWPNPQDDDTTATYGGGRKDETSWSGGGAGSRQHESKLSFRDLFSEEVTGLFEKVMEHSTNRLQWQHDVTAFGRHLQIIQPVALGTVPGSCCEKVIAMRRILSLFIAGFRSDKASSAKSTICLQMVTKNSNLHFSLLLLAMAHDPIVAKSSFELLRCISSSTAVFFTLKNFLEFSIFSNLREHLFSHLVDIIKDPFGTDLSERPPFDLLFLDKVFPSEISKILLSSSLMDLLIDNATSPHPILVTDLCRLGFCDESMSSSSSGNNGNIDRLFNLAVVDFLNSVKSHHPSAKNSNSNNKNIVVEDPRIVYALAERCAKFLYCVAECNLRNSEDFWRETETLFNGSSAVGEPIFRFLCRNFFTTVSCKKDGGGDRTAPAAGVFSFLMKLVGVGMIQRRGAPQLQDALFVQGILEPVQEEVCKCLLSGGNRQSEILEGWCCMSEALILRNGYNPRRKTGSEEKGNLILRDLAQFLREVSLPTTAVAPFNESSMKALARFVSSTCTSLLRVAQQHHNHHRSSVDTKEEDMNLEEVLRCLWEVVLSLSTEFAEVRLYTYKAMSLVLARFLLKDGGGGGGEKRVCSFVPSRHTSAKRFLQILVFDLDLLHSPGDIIHLLHSLFRFDPPLMQLFFFPLDRSTAGSEDLRDETEEDLEAEDLSGAAAAGFSMGSCSLFSRFVTRIVDLLDTCLKQGQMLQVETLARSFFLLLSNTAEEYPREIYYSKALLQIEKMGGWDICQRALSVLPSLSFANLSPNGGLERTSVGGVHQDSNAHFLVDSAPCAGIPLALITFFSHFLTFNSENSMIVMSIAMFVKRHEAFFREIFRDIVREIVAQNRGMGGVGSFNGGAAVDLGGVGALGPSTGYWLILPLTRLQLIERSAHLISALALTPGIGPQTRALITLFNIPELLSSLLDPSWWELLNNARMEAKKRMQCKILTAKTLQHLLDFTLTCSCAPWIVGGGTTTISDDRYSTAAGTFNGGAGDGRHQSQHQQGQQGLSSRQDGSFLEQQEGSGNGGGISVNVPREIGRLLPDFLETALMCCVQQNPSASQLLIMESPMMGMSSTHEQQQQQQQQRGEERTQKRHNEEETGGVGDAGTAEGNQSPLQSSSSQASQQQTKALSIALHNTTEKILLVLLAQCSAGDMNLQVRGALSEVLERYGGYAMGGVGGESGGVGQTPWNNTTSMLMEELRRTLERK